MDLDEAMEKAQEHLDAQAPESVEAAPEPAEVAPEAEAAPVEQAAKPDRERDEGGRYVKGKPAQKPAKEPAAAPKGGANGAAQAAPPAGQGKPAAGSPPSLAAGTPAPETPRVKAPQSWKPDMRELAAKLPAEFHPLLEEVDRRERETARVMQDSAEARKTVERVHQTLAPFAGLARANGMDEMQFAGNVLQTAAALQMGTPQQRAGVIATLIASYGVDVDAINAAMTGQAPRAQQQPQQDVSSLVQQEFNRRVAEAQQTKAAQDWDAFVATSPEFLEDVKNDMREILELAGRQGRNMTYQQAYDRACKLNEGVASVLGQRESAKALRTAQPVTGDAIRAASSVKSRPATAPAAKTKGLDAAMSKAREKLGLG